MQVQVWTAVHEFGAGISTFVALSEAAAKQWLYDIVKEYWSEVAGLVDNTGELDEVPETVPDDQDKAIDLYFYNHPEGERGDIDTQTLEIPVGSIGYD